MHDIVGSDWITKDTRMKKTETRVRPDDVERALQSLHTGRQAEVSAISFAMLGLKF